MASFYERFRPDRDFEDERRVWTVSKPFFDGFKVEFAPYDPGFHKGRISKKKDYSLDPSGSHAREAEAEVGVYLFEWNEGAEPLQEAGWNYLEANPRAVEAALLAKLGAIQRKHLLDHEEEFSGSKSLAKHWEWILSTLTAPPEEAFSQFYKLIGISLAGSGIEGSCFVGYEFQTAWDQDHGLEIVMHRDRVLARGGLTELLSPYGSIIDGIKSTQEYDLDPGDFRPS